MKNILRLLLLLALPGIGLSATVAPSFNNPAILVCSKDYPTPDTDSKLCSTPTGLFTSNITTTTAKFNWTAVGGAVSYAVQYRLAGGAWATVGGSPFTTNYTIVLGFQPGTNYEWRVATNCSAGQSSAWSVGMPFTTLSVGCNVPNGLFTSNITSTTAQINWNAVSGAQSYAVQYRLAGGTWTTAGGSPFTTNYTTMLGFQPGTAYEWRVRTNCSGGQTSAWSGGVAFTTLSAACNTPTGLFTSNITTTTAKINWSAVSGAASYAVQYRLAGGTWTTVGGSPFTTTSTTVTGFQPGTNYEWRVATNCTSGQSSAWSVGVPFTTLSVGCNVPNGLFTSNITATTAQINWNAVSGAQSYAVQYRLAGGTWTTAGGSPFTTNYTTMLGFQPGTAYEWRVRTNCSGGQTSAWSGGVAFTTLSAACNTPGGLFTSNITTTTAKFNWNAVGGALSYAIQYRPAGGSWTTVGGSPFTTTSTTVLGFQPATAYEWRVRTNCSGGQASAWSGGVAFTTLSAGCGTPSGLYATNIDQNTATLNWNAVGGAQSYTVQFLSGSTWVTAGTVPGNSTPVYGLNANTPYQWRIIANCAGGSGSPSAPAAFNTATVPNCNIGTQYPAYALTPNAGWQYQTQVWGGEYCLVNVQAGQVYTFSYCSSDGAYLAFDGEITLRSAGNVLIAYADDVCGDAPRIVWQAGFTGQVRVLLTRYQCATQNTNSILAYRIGAALRGNDLPEGLAETPALRLEPATESTAGTGTVPDSAPEASKSAINRTDATDAAVTPDALLVYPNPAAGHFAIRCDNAAAIETTVEIRAFDPMGHMQWQQTQALLPGRNEWDVPATDWSAGIYLLRLCTGDGRLFQEKVQVLR